uniref:Uncharacterized protein n=1 Tax=Anguilla anguilla TaxID=7936 RepID=A0A0E9UE92_ANGAN
MNYDNNNSINLYKNKLNHHCVTQCSDR